MKSIYWIVGGLIVLGLIYYFFFYNKPSSTPVNTSGAGVVTASTSGLGNKSSNYNYNQPYNKQFGCAGGLRYQSTSNPNVWTLVGGGVNCNPNDQALLIKS